MIEYVGAGRLTTMLGPGGSGKTRLAIEAAHLLLGSYPDGVWLVRLDDLADAELLVATIGAVVGMPENRDKAVIETLADHLADAQTLLVLDNCEHLVESVATLVDTLLAACPSLVVLATSQDALNVAGEQRFPLPPLGLPNDVDIPFDDLETVPAVALFLARAAAINPGLDTSAATIAAVSNIVDALDGIPLAIELAAARTDLLTPAEIARRLADRFEILGAGPRDAPQRQQTLRDTVEWSYGLLDADEQAFFTALSVFSGGFDVAAAAAITKTHRTGRHGEDQPPGPTIAGDALRQRRRAISLPAPGNISNLRTFRVRCSPRPRCHQGPPSVLFRRTDGPQRRSPVGGRADGCL